MRRAVLIDVALGVAFGWALVNLLAGIAFGLVISPIELHGADTQGSFGSLSFAVAGLAFSFFDIVEYLVVLVLLALIAVFVARRFGSVLWDDEP